MTNIWEDKTKIRDLYKMINWGGGRYSYFFPKIYFLPKTLVDQIIEKIAPILHAYEIRCELFSPPHEVEESSS